MYVHFIDAYVQMRRDDLLREAENERLVALATGHGRPLRSKIADWLIAIAERLEGRPRGSVVHARP